MYRKLLTPLLVLLITVPVLAQDDDTVISPDLVENISEIEVLTSELRGLPLLEPVTRLFPTREDVIAFVTADLEAQLDDEIAQRELQFYRAFDFIQQDLDLRAVYGNLLGSQVAGFYDPATAEMNVLLLSGDALGDELPLFESITYAHEFVHALQDQHFDLATFFVEFIETNGEDNVDAAIARQSLVEGDATLVMQEYTLEVVMADPMAAMALLDPELLAAAEIPAGTPFILEIELTFPYLTGMEFVMALREAGGWELVDSAYENPPVSTEHILHPQRYLDGDDPQIVSVENAADVLDGEWELLFERTLGEFYLRQYLGTQLAQGFLDVAATGWGGDRYQLYYSDNNDERAWIMNLALDTPTDAEEFATSFAQFAGLRMGTADSTQSDSGATCWTNADQETLCLQAYADDGFYLAFAPSLADAEGLIDAQ